VKILPLKFTEYDRRLLPENESRLVLFLVVSSSPSSSSEDSITNRGFPTFFPDLKSFLLNLSHRDINKKETLHTLTLIRL